MYGQSVMIINCNKEVCKKDIFTEINNKLLKEICTESFHFIAKKLLVFHYLRMQTRMFCPQMWTVIFNNI